MELVVMLSGMDEAISDHIYARHAYWHDVEILWAKAVLWMVISIAPSGQRLLDLTQFTKPRRLS